MTVNTTTTTTAEAPGTPDPAKVRDYAVTYIAVGIPPEEVRGYARRWPDGPAALWLAAAAEMEALTARGLTARQARASRGNGGARTRWTPAAPAARELAKILLTELTPGDAREAARRSPSERKPMWRAVAAAMDVLLAEGFDVAAFADQMRAEDEALRPGWAQ